jgi:hypothetical protein
MTEIGLSHIGETPQLFAELRAARDVRGSGGRVQSLIGTAFPRTVPDMTRGSARPVLVQGGLDVAVGAAAPAAVRPGEP